jgi:hypothetical protein
MSSINKRNNVEKSWTTFSGHKAICIAKINGYRCGYVEIPREELQYININNPTDYHSYPINCHGDLTFCGTSYWDEENNNIWIGFDCAHYGDLMDPSINKCNLFSFIYKDDDDNFGTIKYLNFVINECEKIGKQLNELKTNKLKINKQ